MKQNKKQEELQSRRQFFKKAGKAALPILGAIALSQIPFLGKASNAESGCTGTCYLSCKGGCEGCQYTCSGQCKNACKWSCQYKSKY